MAIGFPVKANYVTGEVLTAANMNDLSGTVNLLDSAQYAAGKNKIINGDFAINQRGFSSTSSSDQYGFDRWIAAFSGATATYSAQTFTLGAAPVAGYESKNFARLAVTTGNDFCRLDQRIEDVRNFAGQTITISFWAKGTNPTTAGNLSVAAVQSFGTGGSPSTAVRTVAGTFVLTANWTRYSLTVAVPSISGKTLGTNNNSSLEISFGQEASASTDAWTLDLWGVQAEDGSVASAFQTATGTLQGELAACQRYYQALSKFGCSGYASGSGESIMNTLPFVTAMRATPTVTITSNGTTSRLTSLAIQDTSTTSAILHVTANGAGFAGVYGATAGNASIEL